MNLLSEALIGAMKLLVGGYARWIGALPSARQRIYFANHGSHLDTLVIWGSLPRALRPTTHPVAGADYWGKTPLRRRIAGKGLNALLIDRSGSGKPGEALEGLRVVLRQGDSLIIFPEGTRGKELLPGPFKSGIYFLAKEFPEVELVPVYLENLSRAFPKGAWVPAPITCSARFGKPIAVGPEESKEDFLARARQAVVDLAPVPEAAS